MMALWGIQPISTLDKSPNGLSVPASDPIPLSPLDQARADFHILVQAETTILVSRKQLPKTYHPPSSTLKDFRDGIL